MKYFEILSNKKTILILFFIFVSFNVYFFFQFQALNKIAGQEIKILDLRFGYTLEEVNLFFELLGDDGRMLYAHISKADMFYPIIYGLLLMSLLSFLAKGKSNLYFLNILPFIAVGIDFIENLSILKMLTNFSIVSMEMVHYSAAFTQLKWGFIGLSLSFVIILFFKNKLLSK